MKLNKTVSPLALVALIAALAVTGCHKGFNGKVTNLPGHQNTVGETGNGGGSPTLPPGSSFDAGAQPTPLPIANPTPLPAGPGTTPTADINLDDYNQDRAALAAYTVHFAFDSAVVADNEQANVASVAQALVADANVKLLIEGHCDERGTEEYNRSLGERRALALREALSKDNVDPMRVKTISYGKDKPADPGHDEAAWAKNRRGEFILLHPKNAAAPVP
jgi:peptidoglycan-associated lipoprotein